ncbi:MAG: hypothetical protein JXX28_07110 [Deltaproteobacteria bacterium]|nr:hypothetical protein [Deltaproteobacteria bacterium]
MGRLLALLALSLPAVGWAQSFPDRGADVPNPYNYETNPTWSPPPAEGFRALYVDAAAFIGQLRPAAPVTPGPVPVTPERDGMPVVAGPGDPTRVTSLPIPKPQLMSPPRGDLLLINAASGWAEVQINGARLGTLGPLAQGALHQIPTGTYTVRYTLTSGYAWEEQIETCGRCAPPR